MVDPHRELWRQALRDIFGAGMKWVGIARNLECSESALKTFTSRDPRAYESEHGRYQKTASLVINYYRATWILRVHRALCPQHAAHIAPLLEPDRIPSDEAIHRAAERLIGQP